MVEKRRELEARVSNLETQVKDVFSKQKGPKLGTNYQLSIPKTPSTMLASCLISTLKSQYKSNVEGT